MSRQLDSTGFASFHSVEAWLPAIGPGPVFTDPAGRGTIPRMAAHAARTLVPLPA